MGAESTIPQSFVTEFGKVFRDGLRQMESTLRPYCTFGTIEGKDRRFEYIGQTEFKKRTERYGDTPLMTLEHSNVFLNGETFEWSTLIEDADRVRMMADPKDKYMQRAIEAAGVLSDEIIIAAADAAVRVGENGESTESLPAGQTIAHGNTGLMVDKLEDVLQKAREANWKPKSGQKIVIVCTPKDIREFASQFNYGSQDYDAFMQIQAGTRKDWGNFIFEWSNLLADHATDANVKKCLAWLTPGRGVDAGIAFGEHKAMKVEVEKDPSKKYHWRPYIELDMGAGRLQGNQVWVIESLQTWAAT